MAMVLAMMAGAQADTLQLQPFSAVYSARYSGISLEATHTLAKNGDNQWELSTEARNFMGRIQESSRFHLKDGTIYSDHYLYQRRLLGSSKQEEQLFDWQNNISSYYVDRGRDSEPRREVSLDQHLYDRSNYQLMLLEDLRQGKEPLSYQVADRGRIREYRFARVGEETLQTPNGAIKTVKVERVRDNSERETQLWFAPELDYLMIQMEHTEEGGRTHRLTLSRINQLGDTTRPYSATDDHPAPIHQLASGVFHGK